MFNSILAYLNRPAAFNDRPWLIVVVASLLVCFILMFFEPFGISNIGADSKYYAICGFTLVTTFATLITGYLLPRVFPKFYEPSRWTIGRSMVNNIIIILLISLGNFCLDLIINDRDQQTLLPLLLAYTMVTLFVGIIPAVISSFIVTNYALKRNLSDAHSLNEQLAERLNRPDDDTLGQVVTLSGDTKESVTLSPDAILYIESSGNYVKVNYLLGDTVKQKQLRTTIGNIETDLHNYGYILRCHRAFIVNTRFICDTEGNSQGLHLHLNHITGLVPVSRTYRKAIRDKI